MRKSLVISSLLFPAMLFAQGGTEILLSDMKMLKGKITLTNVQNITNHPGYDNQPFFYKRSIYYSSSDNSQMDIKVYNYRKKTTSTITHTIDNEFSPTITPDKKFISCILQQKDGTQDLVKYSSKGGKPITIIDNLKVGYHAWIDNNNLLLFVLEDSANFNLHHYNVHTKEDKVMAKNIGRSLHKIPGSNAMSFVEKVSEKEWVIRKFDPSSKSVSTIASTIPDRDNLAWTNNGVILMSDGKDIFSFQPGIAADWEKVPITGSSSFKGITRLAVNAANNKVAIVVAE